MLGRAILNYIRHESANQAGHVAFSAILALFPFLLLLSAAANLLGESGSVSGLIRTASYYWPPAVADAFRPAAEQVLSAHGRIGLTVGLLGTLWASSSGVLAIRIALNRAYGVSHGLPFWQARLKVLGFTILGSVALILVFSSVVILPYLRHWLSEAAGGGELAAWLWIGVRYGLAFLVLVVVYALAYLWLPDRSERLRQVLPGAAFGAAMWIAAALLLSYSLRIAGKLELVYGSFAGVVALLVFLYASAATLILGAEVNAVLEQDASPRPRREGSG